MVIYQAVKEKHIHDEQPRISYGIRALRIYDYSREEICCIDDVFTDEKQAQKFVEMLNRNELSPVHLKDVVEDYLAFPD